MPEFPPFWVCMGMASPSRPGLGSSPLLRRSDGVGSAALARPVGGRSVAAVSKIEEGVAAGLFEGQMTCCHFVLVCA